MIQWLPLDLSLPGLVEPPSELYRWLREAGIGIPEPMGEPRVLAYKPRRRAVLGIAGHVLKAYAQEDRFRAALAGLRATSGVSVVPAPAFEAALPDLRLTVQAALGGFAPPHTAALAREAGAVLRDLRRLPAGDMKPALPAHQLAAAAQSVRLVEALFPELGRRLEVLFGRLEAAAPIAGGILAAHGDFHAGQLLRQRDKLAVIDFDELCAALPALDLATYAAHLVRGRDGDLDAAWAALDALVDGYGERPEALAWYLATSILRRAPFPFRCQDEHWLNLLEGMVGAAEAALDAEHEV